MDTSFQIAVELSNVFPVRDIVRHVGGYAWNQVQDAVRSFSKSGSDLFVEEELADIFGRGRVNTEVEKQFREDILRDTNIVPIHKDIPQLSLSSGAGPTVQRALSTKDPAYLRTIIQLSMLGYFNERISLTESLIECMKRREEMGIQGATKSPSFDSLYGVLEACSSQTAAFAWSKYVTLIEDMVQKCDNTYQFTPMDLSLSHNTFLAALDYFYIVQKWPEDRKVVIDTRSGFILLVIWTHYVLGLSVTLKGFKGGDISLPADESHPSQITINWSEQEKKEPEMYMFDSDMEIVLRPESQDPNIGRLEVEERMPIRGLGTRLLRRIFQVNFEPDTRPWRRAIGFIINLALAFPGSIDRETGAPDCSIGPSHILEAADLLFGDCYDIYNIPIPSASYLKQCGALLWSGNDKSVLESLRSLTNITLTNITDLNIIVLKLRSLTVLLVLLAHINNVKLISELPIITNSCLQLDCRDVFSSERPKGNVFSVFFTFCQLIIGSSFNPGDEQRLFMASDSGWTVYLPVIGFELDPSKALLDRICVSKGVPTDSKTLERKSRVRERFVEIKDITIAKHAKGHATSPGQNYSFQPLLRTLKHVDLYSARRDHFELEQVIKVEKLTGPGPEFGSYSASYTSFLEALWFTRSINSCGCDVKTANSFIIKHHNIFVLGEIPFHRRKSILNDNYKSGLAVVPILGDRHGRWLAVYGAHLTKISRVVLRGPECCISCAIEFASSLRTKAVRDQTIVVIV